MYIMAINNKRQAISILTTTIKDHSKSRRNEFPQRTKKSFKRLSRFSTDFICVFTFELLFIKTRHVLLADAMIITLL